MEKYVDEHELVDPLIQLGKSEESNNGESNAPRKVVWPPIFYFVDISILLYFSGAESLLNHGL
jgi:hypothetical protein